MRPGEVFLSHSSLDRPVASSLAQILAAHGINVWYSQDSIQNAQHWHDQIGKALKRCDWFLLLVSKNSVVSKWVKFELSYALRAKQYEERILPIILDASDTDELSWTIGGLQSIDWTNHADVASRTLGTWGIALDAGKLVAISVS